MKLDLDEPTRKAIDAAAEALRMIVRNWRPYVARAAQGHGGMDPVWDDLCIPHLEALKALETIAALREGRAPRQVYSGGENNPFEAELLK